MPANGYLPASELVTVQGSGQNAIRLNIPTASVLRRMQADARGAAVTITLVSSYRGAAGYRAWPTQLDMRARPSLYDITPGILPGLPSGHGDGNCMDIDQGLAWVKKNGSRYGVTFPLAFDHNHARYDGITFAGDMGTPISAEETHEEEEDMAIKGITWTGSDGKTYAAQYSDTGFYSDVQGGQALYNAMNAAGIPFYNTTESHAQKIAADCAKVRSRA